MSDKFTFDKISKDEVEDKDYINISSKTPSLIGRKLAYTSMFNQVPTLIGKITSLRTAMDFVITPMYPRRLLTKNKLQYRDLAKIPNNDEVFVVNYLAILTHFTFARITGDSKLLEALLELPEDIKFTSFNLDKNVSFGMSSRVLQYNYTTANYAYIVKRIFKLIKCNDKSKWNDLAKDLIIEMKTSKEKKLFDGVPFDIEFDEL